MICEFHLEERKEDSKFTLPQKDFLMMLFALKYAIISKSCYLEVVCEYIKEWISAMPPICIGVMRNAISDLTTTKDERMLKILRDLDKCLEGEGSIEKV